MTLVTAENVTEGMEVIDNQGHSGIIVDCSNMHDVNVEYPNGGAGLYCLVKNCPERKPYYDTLYMED